MRSIRQNYKPGLSFRKRLSLFPGLVLASLIITGCTGSKNNNGDAILARVHEKNLYASELAGMIPDNISPEDSLLFVKDHVDKWVRNQLLLFMAETHLTEEEKDVKQQIEDYKTSLMIFKYEQNYIKEKLDTVVHDQEIEEYYEKYSTNFLLNNNLLKGRYIRVERNAPEIWKVRRWYKSDDEEDIKKLEAWCFEQSADYTYFEDKWMYLDHLLNQMPEIYMTPENLLRYRKHFEVRDDNWYYFLKISDFRLESTVAPLEFIQEDIRSILLNKRKLHLIQELEANVYNDALNRGNFIVY